jgi:hypothetical protein
MSTDAGSLIAPRPPFQIDLPGILSLKIRRVKFEAPNLEHFKSSLSGHKQAIEFIIETDGVVPTRAYGPALFVGNIEVNNSELTGKTTWRFLHFEPEKLKTGAPISWGWMKDPKNKRLRTDFLYKVEDGPATSA